jgi:hypothetical protein
VVVIQLVVAIQALPQLREDTQEVVTNRVEVIPVLHQLKEDTLDQLPHQEVLEVTEEHPHPRVASEHRLTANLRWTRQLRPGFELWIRTTLARSRPQN